MKATITVKIDTENGICEVTEEHAETAAYACTTSSLEAFAYDAGQALSDYLQGLG